MGNYTELAETFKRDKTELSFARLYQKLRPGLKNYIRGFCKDGDIAEDLLAITFEKIYRKIDSFNPEYSITTWSYTIAKNVCLRWIKRERNVFTSLEVFNENGSEVVDNDGQAGMSSSSSFEQNHGLFTSEDEMWDEENYSTMKYNLTIQAINNLKPMYRDILIDNLINEMMYKEIAYKIDDKLNIWHEKIEDIVESGGTVSEKENKEYTKYYKTILQRVKNRIRRGKMLIEAEVRENIKNQKQD